VARALALPLLPGARVGEANLEETLAKAPREMVFASMFL